MQQHLNQCFKDLMPSILLISDLTELRSRYAEGCELQVKVGSLQKSNITRAADRDGVTNCNRLVRKMHRGDGGGKVEGTVSFRRDERNPNDPSRLLDMQRECSGQTKQVLHDVEPSFMLIL